MTGRYLIETIVGGIALLGILFLGEAGTAFLALLAITPLYMRWQKIKPDELELQLFYKTGNWTMAAMVLALILIDRFFNQSVNGHLISENWMPLAISAIIFLHGLIGLTIWKTEDYLTGFCRILKRTGGKIANR